MVNLRAAFRGQSEAAASESVRLLVPVAGKEVDERLLSLVTKLAQKRAVQVTLIYVVEVDQTLPLDADLPAESTRGERVLLDARTAIEPKLDPKQSSVTTELLQARSAGAAIVDESIHQNASSILMSSRLTKRHGKVTCGDTIDYVLKNAPCEVIYIRERMPDAILEELEMDVE